MTCNNRNYTQVFNRLPCPTSDVSSQMLIEILNNVAVSMDNIPEIPQTPLTAQVWGIAVLAPSFIAGRLLSIHTPLTAQAHYLLE